MSGWVPALRAGRIASDAVRAPHLERLWRLPELLPLFHAAGRLGTTPKRLEYLAINGTAPLPIIRRHGCWWVRADDLADYQARKRQVVA